MKRGSFASRFGTIAAVGGSVIGLGNIWRFPYVAGENGGAAFILIYLTISFLISIPIMLSDQSGPFDQTQLDRAFSNRPRHEMKWVGYMGILCAFIILSFYCVTPAGRRVSQGIGAEPLPRSHARAGGGGVRRLRRQRLATDRMDARIHRGFGFHRLLGNRKGNRTVQ
ncbi:MAG: hypothetical protein ACLTTP_11825 [Alistipes ihumii]